MIAKPFGARYWPDAQVSPEHTNRSPLPHVPFSNVSWARTSATLVQIQQCSLRSSSQRAVLHGTATWASSAPGLTSLLQHPLFPLPFRLIPFGLQTG